MCKKFNDMNRIYLFLAFFILVTLPSLAFSDSFNQLAATEAAFDQPGAGAAALDPKIERSIFAGYNLSRGNSDTQLFFLRALYKRDRLQSSFQADAETQQGKTSGETSEDSSRASAKYNHLISRYTFLGAAVNFERDDLAGLRYRVVLSPSIGRYITRTNDLRWLVELGPSYVFEKTSEESDDYLAVRVGERMEARLTDSTRLFQEVYGTFKKADDFLLNAQAGVDVAIDQRFGIVLTARNDYDRTPPSGKKQNDVSLITSLRASF